MKYLSSILFALAVMALPLPAFACNFWNSEELASGREQVPHQEFVQWVYDDVSTLEQTDSEGYMALYESILEPPAVKIPIRTRSEDGEDLGSVSMYYSQGEFFLESKGRRFATVDGNLYTWQEGETTDAILTRCIGDTLTLLTYMSDYSGIMNSIYRSYLLTPDRFEVTEEEVRTLLEPKAGTYSDFLVSIRFVRAPLWMSQLTLAFPDCQDNSCDDSELKQVVMEFGSPIPLEEIPTQVKELPNNVTFSPSSNTVSVFLNYL